MSVDDDGVKHARRALLKLGLYVPPAIIGSMLISKSAMAQTPSCGPSTCAPRPSMHSDPI